MITPAQRTWLVLQGHALALPDIYPDGFYRWVQDGPPDESRCVTMETQYQQWLESLVDQ